MEYRIPKQSGAAFTIERGETFSVTTFTDGRFNDYNREEVSGRWRVQP